MMFLEKHWLTLLLLAILICISANARAEVVTNKWIENSPYLYETSNNGPGAPDVYRVYDSEANVVCYKWSTSVNIACTPANSTVLRQKYKKHREFIEERDARIKEAKKYE